MFLNSTISRWPYRSSRSSLNSVTGLGSILAAAYIFVFVFLTVDPWVVQWASEGTLYSKKAIWSLLQYKDRFPSMVIPMLKGKTAVRLSLCFVCCTLIIHNKIQPCTGQWQCINTPVKNTRRIMFNGPFLLWMYVYKKTIMTLSVYCLRMRLVSIGC